MSGCVLLFVASALQGIMVLVSDPLVARIEAI